VTDGAGARLAAAARETAAAAAAAASPAAEAAHARPVGDFTPGFHDQEEVGVHEVSDAAEARRVAALLCARDELIHACDTEVADLDLGRSPLGQGRVLCITVYSGPDLDVGSGPGKALFVDTTEPGVLEAFKPWLERESALKVWHNYGFDRHVLYNHGVDVVGFGGDTMHMARLWDASRLAGYSLAALTEELVGRAKVSMKEIFGEPKLRKDGTPGKIIELPPLDSLQASPLTRPDWVQYAVYDAKGTWLLYRELEARLSRMEWLRARSLFDFYTEYWRPFGDFPTGLPTPPPRSRGPEPSLRLSPTQASCSPTWSAPE